MKISTLTLSLLVVRTTFIVLSNTSQYASDQTLLANDAPITNGVPVPDDYEFNVLGEDHAVIGVRHAAGDDFDIEVYEDTTFTTIIENSTTVGDEVDFVVLDKITWASPPKRGARVTSGTTRYIIENENDVEDYSITETWSGSMDASLGGPVIDLGPPGSWEDDHVYGATVLFDGTTYHMGYHGSDEDDE